MIWVYAWLSIGFGYAVVGAFRGLYDVRRHTVTVLHKGGRRETKETREIPELIATLAVTVVAWPIFPAYAFHQLVMNPVRRRQFERDHPTWLDR